MNAVVARVLDCFYLMEHSMVRQYKCRDCKNTVFCISNMQKTVFLQSLRMIFKKKIHFWGFTECSKHYFSNSCIDHFKTKVAWIHHNILEILLLPSLHLSPPYLCSKVSICQVVWLVCRLCPERTIYHSYCVLNTICPFRDTMTSIVLVHFNNRNPF